jgi:alkylation response protein AidB-like acyl-CoA dehydrogenase
LNFDLSEDEQMLKALAERFVADRYDINRRRYYQAGSTGFSADNWALLAELGLVAAPFDLEDGGAGLDATATALLFEALGKGLVVEPLIDNILVAGRLFAATAPAALREQWLEDIVAGRRRIALAEVEFGSRDAKSWVETRVIDDDRLTGEKTVVPAAGGVDGFIVTARRSGAAGDAAGIGLWFVAAGTPGLTVRHWRLADGSVAASLLLDAVSAVPLDGGRDALCAIAPLASLASLARSAEAIGIMQRLLDETLEYLRTRQQFGVALGSFQAIQHRMVAQYAVLEQARALVEVAIVSAASNGFASAVDGARAFIAEVSLTFGHEMIQFHGGMGVSDELSIGHAHKRLLVLSRWPESPSATLDRVAGIAA